MAFVTWVPNSDGDWDTASNWSGGVLPTSADTVVISTTSVHTISHSTGNDFAGSLSVGNDKFAMTGGTLTVSGASAFADGLSVSGGIANFGTATTITGMLQQSGGALSVGGTLTENGAAQLLGGSLGGSTVLTATGQVILSNYTIAGAAALLDSNLAYQTGNVTLGDASGVGALISISSGASYKFANAVTLYQGAASASVSNAGTFGALLGAGTSYVNVNVTSTGAVFAAQGSGIVFQGPVTSLAGSIAGPGTVYAGGGATTLAAGLSVTVGTFSIYNNATSVTLGGNIAMAGAFSQSWGSTLALGGFTLTIAGAASFSQYSGTPLVTGGTLVTNGSTSIGGGNPGLVVGGGAVWDNNGTITAYQGFYLGNSAGAGTLVNGTKGVLDLTASYQFVNGSTPASLVTNAGTVALIGYQAGVNFGPSITSTGVISSAATDNLEFDGPVNSISGSISGAGQVSFANASSTSIAAGTKDTAGTLSVYTRNTTLTVKGAVTDSGNFTMSDGSTLALSSAVFTVSGAATFGQNSGSPLIDGTGTIVTAGTTTLGGNTPVVLGGAAKWSNQGTIIQQGYFDIGDSASSSASLVNTATGVIILGANTIHIANGSTLTGFTNAGLLETAVNAGTAYVDVNTTSTGKVTAAQGSNLVFEAAIGTFSGVIGGTGEVSFAAGINTLAANMTLSAGTIVLYDSGTTLAIAGADTISGFLDVLDGAVLALGANTLTLTGATQFQQRNGSADVTGTGALLTKATTTLINGGTPLVIGGNTTWTNSGYVVASGRLQIGDSGSSTAALVNATGGTYLLDANGVAIGIGSSFATFTNAGLLESAINVGTAYVDAAMSSTGTVLASQGSNLVFDGAGTAISGVLTGAGQVSFSTSPNSIAAGTSIGVGTLAVYNPNGGGTTLSLAGTQTMGGFVSLSYGGTLALGGATSLTGSLQMYDNALILLGANTLTETGNGTFSQRNGAPDIRGTGSFVTKGTTSLNGGGTALTIGGSANWVNQGTVFDGANYATLGDSTGAAATLTNAAGATFEMLYSGGYIANNSTPLSSLVNAGTLEMLASGATDYITVLANSTGTVLVAQSDNLEFDGAIDSFSGTLSGAGQLSIGGGTATIAAGTALSIGTLAMYHTGSEIVLGGSLTDSGAFSQGWGSTLALGGGTFTIAGGATFEQLNGSPLVTGPGTLVTQGVTNLLNNGGPALVLGSTAAWANAGTVLQYQSLQVGNTGNQAASVVNEAGATFDLVASTSITNGSSLAETFSNAGTFVMSGFGDASSMTLALSNTGTVLAQGGSMSFSGAVSGTGTLEVSAGGDLGFSGTVAATQVMDFLDNTGTLTLSLPIATAFAATINGFAAGDFIDLQGISGATEKFANGTLTFTNSASQTVAVLHFGNSPNFTFGTDGGNGTLIGAH